MEPLNYYTEEGFPFRGRKLERLKAFLRKNQLTYDENIQYSLLLYTRDGRIAGCGSRHENILKCIAIDPDFQGEGLLQLLVTQLIKNACAAGFSHLFLFTKPKKLPMFSDMGFYPILETEEILLMENRKNGISAYLSQEAASCPSPFEGARVGAVVMNANPFTKGHLHLVRTAAKACDLLHVFVLSQDASEFPPQVRLSLVQKGCQGMEGVYIHGSSDYLISHATFPDYFLKDKAKAKEDTARLDLEIFGSYFKKAFGITCRFVGEEPFSPITDLYNQQMKRLLPRYGIEVIEIPRLQEEGGVISATRVRELFLKGRLSQLQKLVPPSTYAYLASPEGEALRNALQQRKEERYES